MGLCTENIDQGTLKSSLACRLTPSTRTQYSARRDLRGTISNNQQGLPKSYWEGYTGSSWNTTTSAGQPVGIEAAITASPNIRG